MSRHIDIFILILSSFIVGIGLAELFDFKIFKYLILNISIVLLLLSFFFKKRKENGFKIFLILGLSALSLFAGLWKAELNNQPKNNLVELKDQQAQLIGPIVEERELSGNRYRYTVSVENDRILVTSFLYPDYNYGDKIKITGQLQKPAIFDDFDYRSYLQKEGIDWVMYYPKIKKIDSGNGQAIKTKLLEIKEKLRRSIFVSINSPEDTVLKAMLLGDRDRLTEETSSLFSRVGIRHIVAISGLHITIIAGIFLIILTRVFKLSKNKAFYFAILMLAMYILMVGAPPSAIRAGIMASLLLLAEKLGRPYFLERSLLLAAFLMLLFNPLLLSRDIGFQLSFTAVLGIYYIAPIVNKIFEKIQTLQSKKLSWFLQIIAVTLGAQIAVTPLIAYHFGLISIISPIANVVIVPLLPILISAGVFGAIIGIFSQPLGQLLFIPIEFLLSAIFAISKNLDKIPYSSLEVGLDMGLLVLFFIYLFIIFAVFLLRRKLSISEVEYGIIIGRKNLKDK